MPARADVSWPDDSRSTQFWSNADALCTLPDCGSVQIKTTRPVTITVSDTDGAAAADLPVYAFSGGTYTGYTARTDASGQVRMILPEGAYRFRSDLNSTQFWSSADDACSVLTDTSGGAVTCDSAAVTVTKPMTVTVLDSNGAPMADLPVYAFNGETYSGYTAKTDVNGQASLTLPVGSYRFRSDLGTTHFWTAADATCEIPGCAAAEIRTTLAVTVTVKGKSGNPYPDLPVYAFMVTQPDPLSGSTEPVVTYSGYNGKTDANGQVILTLPAGDYRFRSDYDGVQFWSDTEKACSVLAITTAETPGCQTAEVVLPGGTGKINVTIDYKYDDLNRITSAIYTDAENTSAAATSFTYSYDAAGNVEEYVSVIAGQTVTTTYRYNAANELVSATRNNVVWVYEYDGNGALLSTQPESGLASGSKKYSYNTAGYLTKVEAYTGTAWYTQAEMSYTGIGDRLSMTGSTEDGQSVSTTYALSNGTMLLANASGKVTSYLYGIGAIGEQTDAWSYALIDGTGTPRQMVDQSAKVTALASYTPWGDVLQSGGTGSFATGMMGGLLDETTGLIYVGNGQYFDPETGRFLTRGNQRNEGTNPYTPWKGDPTQALVSPLILLALLYTRRKNRNKFDTLLVVLVLLSAVGLSLSAYTPVQAEALPASSGGGAGAPSMPMGYASTAEAGTSSGVEGINPGSGLNSPNYDDCPKPHGPVPGFDGDIEQLLEVVEFIGGFLYQFANDMTFGLPQSYVNKIMIVLNLIEQFTGQEVTLINTSAYYQGAQWGRNIATDISNIELAYGVIEILYAICIGIGGGTLAVALAPVSGGGGSLVIGGAAVTSATAAFITGAVIASVAAGQQIYMSANPVPNDPTLSYGSNTGDTKKNARLLRKDMGVGQTPGYAAHHISPSTDPYPAAQQSREILEKWGIDINSKANGVLLPTDIHNGLARNHEYMDAVLKELRSANSKEEAVYLLQDIGERLLKGTFPR